MYYGIFYGHQFPTPPNMARIYVPVWLFYDLHTFVFYEAVFLEMWKHQGSDYFAFFQLVKNLMYVYCCNSLEEFFKISFCAQKVNKLIP